MIKESLQRRLLTKLYPKLTAEDIDLIIDSVESMGVDVTILDESKFTYCITLLGSVIDDIRAIEVGERKVTLEQCKAIKTLITNARLGK